MPIRTPSPGPTPSPRFKVAIDYKFELKSSPGLTTDILTFPSGSKLIINFPSFVAVGDTFSGTVQTEAAGGKDEKQRARNQAELEKSVLLLGGQPVRVAEKVFTRTIPQQINADGPFIILKVNGKEVVNAQLPISQTSESPPSDTQLPTCGQMGKNVVVMDHCDGVIAPNDSCSIAGTPLQPLAESPRMRVLQNTSNTPGATQINYREQGKETSGPFQNFGVQLSAGNLSLLRGQQTTLLVTVTGLTGIQQDMPLDLINVSPAVINMEGGNAQHFDIHQADVAADGTYKIQRGLTGIQPGAFQITATVVCAPEKPTNPERPIGPGPKARSGPTPPPGGPPPPRTAASECEVGTGTPYDLVLKKGPGVKHVEVVKPKKDEHTMVGDDGTTITWKTTSKTNDPVPLVVDAWDIDLRDYSCNCYATDPSGSRTKRCTSLKSLYVVDVLNYVWSEVPAPPGAFLPPVVPPGGIPPGAKGKFLAPPYYPGSFGLGIVGPATLYQPPDLAEGAAPFTALLKVEISDYPFGYGDDPPTSVIFKLEVVHHKDGYVQTVLVPKPKSIYETIEEHPPPPPKGGACPCKGDEKFEKGKIEAAATSDEVKACPGQKVVLISKLLGSHKLTKICNGCGHSEEESGVFDATTYSWTADGSKDNGSKVNGAEKTDTNGWRSTVIYTAPTTPGEYTVTLVGKDSGKQKGVKNDDMKPKKITIKVYKLDLQVGKKSGKSGEYLTKEEVEKDGGYVALNSDDDNQNGIIDLAPEEISPVKDEDDLIPIKLSVDGPEPKDVTLKVTSGPGKIRVWETSDKTKEVKSDAKLAGREVSLDGYGHVFKSASLPKEVWVEGVKSDEKMQGVELTLELDSSDKPPCPAKVKLTVVTVDILDKDKKVLDSPPTITSEHVAVRTQLSAKLTPEYRTAKYEWTVAGDRIKSYEHRMDDPKRHKTIPLEAADLKTKSVSFFWQKEGTGVPVTVTVTIGTSSLSKTVDFEVSKFPDMNLDVYTVDGNENKSPGYDILEGHGQWHKGIDVNGEVPAFSAPKWGDGTKKFELDYHGEAFLRWHRELLESHEKWRDTFNVGAFIGANPPPGADKFPKPEYLKLSPDSSKGQESRVYKYVRLGEYQDLDELGRDVVHRWHNDTHMNIAGATGFRRMGTFSSPGAEEDTFWKWHSIVDEVRRDWKVDRAKIVSITPTEKTILSAAPSAIIVAFDRPVSKNDGIASANKIHITAGKLTVNGSPAKGSVDIGVGTKFMVYEFSGFDLPKEGEVKVELLGTASYEGKTYTFTYKKP